MHTSYGPGPAAALLAAALFALTSCASAPAPSPRREPAPQRAAPATTPAPEAANNRVTGLGGSSGRAGGAQDYPGTATPSPTPATAPSQNAVELKLYLMSKCPYAVQALDGVTRAMVGLPGAVKLKLDYIVTEDFTNGQFKALHGLDEVRGNILQLCVQHNHSPATFLKFLSCQNRNWRQIPAGWEQCARDAGVPVAALGQCANSGVGDQLLRDSMHRSKAAGAKGSPTIYLAGKAYSGGRSKRDFMKAVCNAIPAAERPGSCTQFPPPVQVQLTVLNDRRCKDCKTAAMVTSLRSRFFPALTVKELDYSDPEGRRLYRQLKLKHLPALLLAQGVEKADMFPRFARWLKLTAGYYVLKMPSRFDPTAEICDNNKDDTGNRRVDCADPTCRKTLICRRNKRRRLDVFVMSQCPFGVRALDAMREVLSNFKGKLRFDIHYIAEKKADGSFNALHGQPEVEENIRHLCAKKYYRRGNKYLDYIWCRNRNYRSDDWKPCATGGISQQVIERCASGAVGKLLLARDLKEAKALKISGSPTFLANNRHKFNGITAEKIKTEVCRHNPRLPGCGNTLSSDANAPAGACGK
jgi:Gamma interferon inducible lysosomal thiol reductase (GILT)